MNPAYLPGHGTEYIVGKHLPEADDLLVSAEVSARRKPPGAVVRYEEPLPGYGGDVWVCLYDRDGEYSFAPYLFAELVLK